MPEAFHPAIRAAVREKTLLEQQRQRQQGFGRRIVSTELDGVRQILVGNKIFSGRWKTFTDFLPGYLRTAFGEEWGAAELAKPLTERHPVLIWYHHVCQQQQKYNLQPERVTSRPVTGADSAFFRLAYNLYLIAHNGHDIQGRLIGRLRNPDNFAGAFFETQVAAWFVNAGFVLEFEDEADGESTHCEFTATFPTTGRKFSVEAKSRNPTNRESGQKKIKVIRQLADALRKKANHTRIVFLDLDRRIHSKDQADRLVERARWLIKKDEGRMVVNGHPAPPAHICITNLTDQYFLESTDLIRLARFLGFKISDGIDTEYPSVREAVRARERQPELFSLIRSMEHHATIPVTFDGQLPSEVFEPKNNRYRIGRSYTLHRADGRKQTGTLSTASVDLKSKTALLAFHDPQTDEAWIEKMPMSDAEVADYLAHSDIYFGEVSTSNAEITTPIELFDFFYRTEKNASKERLLELLSSAPDIMSLRNLDRKELCEIYCERLEMQIFREAQMGTKPEAHHGTSARRDDSGESQHPRPSPANSA